MTNSEKRQVSSKASDDVEAVAARIFEQARVCDDASYVMVPRFLIGKLREAIKAHGIETLHVGASDWEEFGIAVRTVSQNCDMTDIARRGDWLQRELRARGFDIVRSGREDTPDEFRSAHVINVPWCQCCEARVPADHVCACEVIAEPSKEWWKCEYSGPGGQCGRDNHYARATCWYCHHPRVNAQKAGEQR